MSRMQSAGGSDVGRVRQSNQDSLGIFEPVSDTCSDCLYILCDGMGAYRGGEVASQLAVERIIDTYGTTAGHRPVDEALRAAIEQAQLAIRAKAQTDQNLREMGTTVVLALVSGEELWIANVGDSRAYLVRGDAIQQLSVDHSQVGSLVRAGCLTWDQAQKSTRRNILSRSLSALGALAEPAIVRQKWETGDGLVLCSDGLWGRVAEHQIRGAVQRYAPERAVQMLIALANRAGGDDNVSVVVVQNGIVPKKTNRWSAGLVRLARNPWLVSLVAAVLLAALVLTILAIFLLR